jgi:hypothetical protein
MSLYLQLASFFHNPESGDVLRGRNLTKDVFILCRVPNCLTLYETTARSRYITFSQRFFRLTQTTCVIYLYVVLLYLYKDREEPI